MGTSKFIRLLFSVILALFLLVIPWFHGAAGLFEQLSIQTGIYAISLLFFAVFLPASKESPSSTVTAIDYGFIIAVLLVLLSTVISVLPFYSLMTAVRFGAVVAFYGLIRTLSSAETAQKGILGSIVAAGLFYGIFGLLQLKGVYPRDYWYETHSLASRYVNSGHFAGFLVMSFFSALLFLVLAKSWAGRVFFFTLLMFVSCIVVLTKSRTVWISLVLGMVCFLLFINRIKPFSRKACFYFLTGTAGVLATAVLSGLGSSVLLRFSELKSMNFFSIYHRFHFWEGALAAILNRPWGWGLGTFVHIFPRFRVHSDRFIVDYAHNELLQLGVDFGVLGIAVFIFLLGMYLRVSWIAVQNPERSFSGNVKIAGITASIFTLALCSQFDFPLRIYANAFFAAALLGIQSHLMGPEGLGGRETLFQGSLKRIFFYKRELRFAVFAFAGLVLSGAYLNAEVSYQQGRRLEKNFDWDLAMGQYELSRRFAPWSSEYDEAGGRLSEKRAALMMNPEARRQWLERALDFYTSASRKNAYWPASFYKAGGVSARLGDSAGAEFYLRSAHERDPKNPLFTFEYGLKQLEAGNLEQGIGLLEGFIQGGYYDPVPLTQTQILKKIYPYVKEAAQLRKVIFKGAYPLHDLGLFLVREGQGGQGALILQEAAKEIRVQDGYLFYLEHFGMIEAQTYVKAGMFAEAAAIYEEAVKQSPNPSSYQGYLDSVLQSMKGR